MTRRVCDRHTLALLVLAPHAGPVLTGVVAALLLGCAVLFGVLSTSVQIYHAYIGLPSWLFEVGR